MDTAGLLQPAVLIRSLDAQTTCIDISHVKQGHSAHEGVVFLGLVLVRHALNSMHGVFRDIETNMCHLSATMHPEGLIPSGRFTCCAMSQLLGARDGSSDESSTLSCAAEFSRHFKQGARRGKGNRGKRKGTELCDVCGDSPIVDRKQQYRGWKFGQGCYVGLKAMLNLHREKGAREVIHEVMDKEANSFKEDVIILREKTNERGQIRQKYKRKTQDRAGRSAYRKYTALFMASVMASVLASVMKLTEACEQHAGF